MIATQAEAEQKICCVHSYSNCVGRQCMAWNELADGRGYCGHTSVPPEAIAQFVKAVIQVVPIQSPFFSLDS